MTAPHRSLRPRASASRRPALPTPTGHEPADHGHGAAVCDGGALRVARRRVLLSSVALRLLNCGLVHTFFVPDEYWQAVEPAHRIVFGTGTVAWEWHAGLRSYVYPLYLSAALLPLRALGLDYRFAVVHAPRLLHSVTFACAMDCYLFELVVAATGSVRSGRAALLLCATNWFVLYCAPRTLANGAEAALLVVALYYYPWPQHWLAIARDRQERTRHSRMFAGVAALATVIRPTALVFWAALALGAVLRLRRQPKALAVLLLRQWAPVGAAVAAATVIIDCYYYNRFTVPLYNFVQFNVLQGGSAHFGSHPLHWYVTHGLPPVLLGHGVLAAFAVRAGVCRRYPLLGALLGLAALYVLAMSLLAAHKEHRFLLPIVPLICAACAPYAVALHKRNALWLWLVAGVNVPLIMYTCLVHQRGALDLPAYLHSVRGGGSGAMHVYYLMPCYSSPHHSHMHANVTLSWLDCEPNFDGRPEHVDEADVFHADPVQFVRHSSAIANGSATHLVLFERMWLTLRATLHQYGYVPCRKFFNSHFPLSDRQSQYIIVACR